MYTLQGAQRNTPVRNATITLMFLVASLRPALELIGVMFWCHPKPRGRSGISSDSSFRLLFIFRLTNVCDIINYYSPAATEPGDNGHTWYLNHLTCPQATI